MTSSVSKGALPALKRCAGAALTAAVITAVLLAAEALVLTKVDMDSAAYGPMGAAASALGTAAAAFVSSKKYGEKGLVFGSATGGILSLIVMALGAALGGESLAEGTIYKFLTLITAGGLGGFLGLGGRAAKR